MGKIYCVMGKSSSGKDTVYKKLKEQYKEFRLIVPLYRPVRSEKAKKTASNIILWIRNSFVR